MAKWGFHDWKAVETAGPGGRRRLRVSGTLVVPTSGYGVELRRHDPQEAERELLLDLIVHEPTGPVLQVVSGVQVSYDEDDGEAYERVSILPLGPRAIGVDQAVT